MFAVHSGLSASGGMVTSIAEWMIAPRTPVTSSGGEGAVLLPGGHLLIAKEKKPAAFIEFGPPHSRSRGLVRGGALADGEPWSIKKGHHRFVALAIWLPDKTLAKTCADFSDLEIGPDDKLPRVQCPRWEKKLSNVYS